MKWRFALRFLTTFALLIPIWWAVDFGPLYRSAALSLAQIISPITNGWLLEFDRPGFVDDAVFLRGDQTLPMLLQLPALAMGLMPLISLIVATPGQTPARIAVCVVAGSVLYLLVDVLVVLVYPFIMDQPNTFKDTVGVFSGLVAFVVAPLGIWFGLTYPALSSIWQLTPQHRAKA